MLLLSCSPRFIINIPPQIPTAPAIPASATSSAISKGLFVDSDSDEGSAPASRIRREIYETIGKIKPLKIPACHECIAAFGQCFKRRGEYTDPCPAVMKTVQLIRYQKTDNSATEMPPARGRPDRRVAPAIEYLMNCTFFPTAGHGSVWYPRASFLSESCPHPNVCNPPKPLPFKRRPGAFWSAPATGRRLRPEPSHRCDCNLLCSLPVLC